MKRVLTYAAAGLIGIGIGAYSALAMSGLLPGDRRIGDGIEINGWVGDLSQGSVDASPYLRTRIARHGLLALANTEAIYFIRAYDDAGDPLSEQCTYRISGGELPAGWWSITLYNDENFLPANGDDALSFDASRAGEGEWSVDVSANRPPDGASWISSRNAGEFDLTLRLYMPERSALENPNAEIAAPNVELVGCQGDEA